MLERRDQVIQNCLVFRDQEWLNGLHHCKESLRLMTLHFINNRATLESVGKRQRELTKGNVEILNWAMETISRKKKVPFPNIQIFDYVPYIIVPKDVQHPNIPFTNPNEHVEMPFVPPRQFTDIPVQTKKNKNDT